MIHSFLFAVLTLSILSVAGCSDDTTGTPSLSCSNFSGSWLSTSPRDTIDITANNTSLRFRSLPYTLTASCSGTVLTAVYQSDTSLSGSSTYRSLRIELLGATSAQLKDSTIITSSTTRTTEYRSSTITKL